MTAILLVDWTNKSASWIGSDPSADPKLAELMKKQREVQFTASSSGESEGGAG
jgi:hypothetical protein